MIFNIALKDKVLFKGEIPYLLNNYRKSVIYVASSNRNIEDYTNTLKEIGNTRFISNEGYDYIDDERSEKNYEIIETIKKDENFILITSIDGLIRGYKKEVPPISLKVGEEISLKGLLEKLEGAGYGKTKKTLEKHTYSKRGDILDIYLISEKDPIRIEFFDNEIERMAFFNIKTQRQIKEIKDYNMYIDNNKDYSISLMELIDIYTDKEVDVIVEERDLLKYKLEERVLRERDLEDIYKKRYEEGTREGKDISIKRFTSDNIEWYQEYKNVVKVSKDKKVYILSGEEERYKKLFDEENVEVVKSYHYEGFEKDEYIVLTDRELKGIRVKKEEDTRKNLYYKDITEIKEEDYIIHENYGVGKYIGIEIINEKDYLTVKYAGEDKLFVPIDRLNKIEKYICDPSEEPEIYGLGRKGFRRKKKKMEENLLEFAGELIEIQARRDSKLGYAFTPDTVWQDEFEEGFPYTETRDQLDAINDVKRDMESSRVMDRVVCGDVGYGKTEVAMRAAFKAIMSGKQVALLAPTTVLANQHYERFQKRFKNFPIEIELLSRLVSKKEQEEGLKGIIKGEVDLVIGTHRLLSPDIHFNDLGLVIVDEEQKFGVKAKEKLKKLRTNVDMLTLTATPIPRTLNMSLLGIRDLSIIRTPPKNRLPIKTYFLEQLPENIKNVVIKEVAREGQVFYLYNSVIGMKKKVRELEEILPEYVKISYINGQMSPKDVKDRIRGFEEGEIDILVSTTIIENGIDIENANTIIIEGYEKLGLAQIYQLRGRVGRGGKKAYCYLLQNEYKKLTKKGKKRRETLENAGDFGIGFQLSLEDMKIRGVGEILGDKQHGMLQELGYDLYIKMLNEKIKEIKGQKEENIETDLEILKRGYIPSEYIEESEKIIIYKRLLDIKKKENLEDLRSEMRDRFGKLPSEVEDLLRYTKLKIVARSKNIVELKEVEEDLYRFKIDNESADLDKIRGHIESKRLAFKRGDILEFKGDIQRFLEEEY